MESELLGSIVDFVVMIGLF